MRSLLRRSLPFALPLTAGFLLAQEPVTPSAPTAPAAEALLRQQTIPFVPNVGQWDRPTRFEAHLGATTAYLEADGFRLVFTEAPAPKSLRQRLGKERVVRETLRGAAVRLAFAGAGAAEVVGEAALAVKHGYFLGNDATRWRSEVQTFGAVRYRGVHAGVDVLAYTRDGHFEYDFEIAANGDLAAVVVQVEGAERLTLEADGSLVLHTAVGAVRQPAPATFEIDEQGQRRPVAARYRLLSPTSFGFEVPAWRRDRSLVVDPGVLWATTLAGGSVGDLAVDASGTITIVGSSGGLGYPATVGALSGAPLGNDCFVTRIDPSLPTAQQHRYTTYFGGNGDDFATEVVVAANGVVTVAGTTDLSASFPTTVGAFDTSYGGGSIDSFVIQLDPSLVGAQQLRYATYLGGSGDDLPYDLATGFGGELLVAGFSDSTDYPLSANAFDTTVTVGFGSAVVSWLDPTQVGAAQLVYSTYLGGSRGDDARTVAMDALQRIFVAGYAESTNFPTTAGALQTVHASPIQADAYVAMLDPAQPPAQQLVWSTLYGGVADDWIDAIVVDAIGSVVTAAGTTGSANLAMTPNAFLATATQPSQQFFGSYVARFDPNATGASQLTYASYLVGSGFDFSVGLAVTRSGALTVLGNTDAPDFPVTDGAYSTTNPGQAVYLVRLDPNRPPAQQLVYGTFFGGSSDDIPTAFAVDADDEEQVTVAGYVFSLSFPTTPGAFGTPLTGSDFFVARLDLRPTGCVAYGNASSGCSGLPSIGALSWPQVGNAAFAFTCTSAPLPPLGLGVAVLNLAPLPAAVPVLGIDLWVNPVNAPIVPVLANAFGTADLPLPLPSVPSLAGQQISAQFAFLDVVGPAPCTSQGWAASNAMVITIQP